MGPHDEVSQATETTESTLNYSLNPRIAGRQRSRRARTLATAVISALALVMGTLTAPAANASESLDAATAYVSAVYADLFHRAPDADGLRTWSAALISGTPRVAVANSITASDEYRSRLIVGSYREYLGRAPDAAGLQNWLTYLRAGRTLQQMEAGFLAADEYYARAGSTPANWVTQLYDNVLGRTPSQDEVSGWVSILARGSSRGEVALGFLLSTEHLRTVVDGYYVDLLGRSIDASGADTWVSAIQRGTRLEQVIGLLVSSTEYVNSHGSTNSSPALPA